MSKLTPFADDAASVSIGGLTVENGTDRVALYGSLDLTRDRQGLARARALKTLLDQLVERLEPDTTFRRASRQPRRRGRSQIRSADLACLSK